ncbi:MAG: Flp pilus assembly complex ATPase component TadA [Clostridia bacterium]|nr:Flp pilus assembly complex ATPase component TadA [Clostridia bacterium]
MNDVKTKNRIISAATPLVPLIRNTICNMSDENINNLREIRLRVGLPVALNIGGVHKYIAKNGCIVDSYTMQNMLVCNDVMINDAFKNICGFSVHAHLSEITSGFITMPYGHRAGICGTAVMSEGKIINIRDISSISIRISRQITDVSRDMSARFAKSFGGLLICGAPASGKTTFLRDMARLLSTEYSFTTSVIDTRNELSGSYRGKPQNDLGFSDILVSYPRIKGIEHALRSLSPQIIICDEIGTKEDAEAILSATNSGVRFIASIHASTPKELKERMYAKEILSTNAFSAVAFMSSPLTPGRVSRILSVGDVLSA